MALGKPKTILSAALFLSILLLAKATAAAVNDSTQIKRQIHSIEYKIGFEKVWEQKLQKAQQKLELLQDANSELGRLFRSVANTLTRGESEQTISNQIVRINSKLNPFFRIDNKGNLTFGSALQMLGIQAQFTSPGISLLTPKSLLTVIVGWRNKNTSTLQANQADLTRLQQQLSALKSSQSDNSARTSATEQALQQQIDRLAVNLTEAARRIPLLKKVVREGEKILLEMTLHLSAINKAEKQVVQSMDTVKTLQLGWATTSEYLQRAREGKNMLLTTTSNLVIAYRTYANASMIAKTASEKICDFTRYTSSQPVPSPAQIKAWNSEASAQLSAASLAVEAADNTVRSLAKKQDSTSAMLNSALRQLASLNRQKLREMFEQLKAVKQNLDNAVKTLTRVKELKKVLIFSQAATHDMKNKLLASLHATFSEASTLGNKLAGRKKLLKNRVSQIRARAARAEQTVQGIAPAVRDANLPEVPKLSATLQSLLQQLQLIDKSGVLIKALFDRVDATISEGKQALTEAENAVVAGLFATKNTPQRLSSAKKCFAELTKIVNRPMDRGVVDQPSFNTAELTAILQKIITITNQMSATWEGQLIIGKLTAYEQLCLRHNSGEKKQLARADLLEKAEQTLTLQLELASSLAKKCPNVNNPENINKLYEQAKQLTVRIGADVVLIKKQAAIARLSRKKTEKMQANTHRQVESLLEKIEKNGKVVAALWKSVASLNLLNTAQRLPEIERLLIKATAAIENSRNLVAQAQKISARIQDNSQCKFQTLNTTVSRAETAYAAALISYGANKGLPAAAATCQTGGKNSKADKPVITESNDESPQCPSYKFDTDGCVEGTYFASWQNICIQKSCPDGARRNSRDSCVCAPKTAIKDACRRGFVLRCETPGTNQPPSQTKQ